jgi:hypothetical protein
MKFSLVFATYFLLSALLVHAQDSLVLQYSKTITKEELSAHVYYLASDGLEGRHTGTKGLEKAEKYIIQEFRDYGLMMPAYNQKPSFSQEFMLDYCRWKDQRLLVDNKSFRVGRDFLFLDDPVEVQGKFPVVFAGFGMDDSLYSDFGKIDVKNKVVLAFTGEPLDDEGNSLVSGCEEASKGAYYFSKAATASLKGATGLILIARKRSEFTKYLKNREYYNPGPGISYPEPDPEFTKKIPLFTAYMSLKTAAALVQERPAKLKSALDDMEKQRETTAGRFEGSVSIKATSDCIPFRTANVIGMVEGSDLSAGAVVVIAHYDHLGRSGDEIFHGADDNATGTAAVMEIAQAFGLAAEQGYRPRRTLIFIAASAEELGLYGSRYYTEHPLVPLDSTVACLNIDMIGRGSRKFSLTDDYIGGYVFLSKELLEVSEAGCKLTAPALADKIEYRKAIRGGSDHYHFATHGVPSIFYHTGLHSDYHKPSDTPDKILYDRMELIVRAIFATAWELANREERVDTGN